MNLRGIDDAAEEIIAGIKNGEIKNKNLLEKMKIKISKKYNLPKIVKSADIMLYMKENSIKDLKVESLLSTKPVRTGSGVSNIAIMWLGENDYSCPFECIFCPQGDNSPKAYTGVEPTTMRAKRNDYDAFKQVRNRLTQLNLIGHHTDKNELIIMGGTFMAWDKGNREEFIKRAFDGFNNKDSSSLREAQKINETTGNRVIGLTIETRADYTNDFYIDEMLRYGTTRIEIGVQTTDEKLQQLINRGHDCKKNIEAFKRLRDVGFKITAHWMPGLTGLEKFDIEKEKQTFKELFSNPDYRPDELKIYPTLVIPGTKLHKLWKQGKYKPLDMETMINLLIEMKKEIPKYVRVKRIMRDISEHEAEAGARKTNLRQMALERGVVCKCIRCREIKETDAINPKIDIYSYEAGGKIEKFISFEDEKGKLIGFIRLRLCEDIARIREMHVYGKQIPLKSEKNAYQHSGYGLKLLEEAEKIAKSSGYKKISVTAGIGVKEYFRKHGYVNDSYYMSKEL